MTTVILVVLLFGALLYAFKVGKKEARTSSELSQERALSQGRKRLINAMVKATKLDGELREHFDKIDAANDGDEFTELYNALHGLSDAGDT